MNNQGPSKLIRSKRRTISLEINSQGELIVRAPLRTSLSTIQSFIQEKQGWIVKKQTQIQEKQSKIIPKQFIAGETFFYLGTAYKLSILPQVKNSLVLKDEFQLAFSKQANAKNIFTQWYKKQALDKFTDTVNRFGSVMSVNYKTIKLSSAKKRWGSCSSTGNLNFTWRLIMAPQFIIDYVVVHELAHLHEMNHSKKFWRHVEEVYPDYKGAERWLKENEHLLIFSL